MKKQLMLSTAIATGAMLLLAGQAAAGDVKTSKIDLTIGGSLDFQAGIGNDDEDLLNSRGYDFVTDTEIHFDFRGVAENGLTYGAKIELETDQGATNNVDEANIYLFGDFGRVELGDQDGAEDQMIYDAGLTQSGVGGIDGDVDRWFINLGGLAGAASFPDIIDTSDATKVTYYTPRFSGFQAGVSFTPEIGSNGQDVAEEKDGDGAVENHVGLGANYQNTFNGVDFGVAIVGGFGNTETLGFDVGDIADEFGVDAEDEFGLDPDLGITISCDDVSNFAVGANVGYQGFTLAGSYGRNGDSGCTDDSWFWDIGVGYGQGPWSVSVGYLRSESEVDVGDIARDLGFDDPGFKIEGEFQVFSVSAGYDVAPGLYAYADLLFPSSELKIDDIKVDNDATILLLGTVVKF